MLWPSNEKVKSSKWDQGPARHWHWGQAGALVKLHVPLSLTADAITPSASLMFDMALPFDVSDVLEHHNCAAFNAWSKDFGHLGSMSTGILPGCIWGSMYPDLKATPIWIHAKKVFASSADIPKSLPSC